MLPIGAILCLLLWAGLSPAAPAADDAPATGESPSPGDVPAADDSSSADRPPAANEAVAREIVNDMLRRGPQFDVARLHAQGVAGLVAVLDWLLPETAPHQQLQLSDDKLDDLLARLGSQSYREREQATEDLYELGPGAKAVLLPATKSADAEISWRVTTVLRKWDQERISDRSKYLAGFATYVQQIEDRPRLEELARRVLLVLNDADALPRRDKEQILRYCAISVFKSVDADVAGRLAVLLQHDNERVAEFIALAAGSASHFGTYPPLLVEALKSQRQRVALAAINSAANAEGTEYAAEVKGQLMKHFAGEEGDAKFRASYPLFSCFDYPPARDYLIEKATSKNRGHQYQALRWLGDTRMSGKPIHPDVLHTLKELCTDQQNSVRRMAASSLGTYGGEEVVQTLIPMLADSYSSLRSEVRRKLQQQPDQAMVRRLLTKAAKDDDDPRVGEEATALLAELSGDQQEEGSQTAQIQEEVEERVAPR